MYLDFYKLNEKPYSYLNPNPRFFYYAPQHLTVKRMADYIVSERNGHIYLYGPIGSGKTSLLKTVSQMLDENENNTICFINAPNLKTSNSLIRRISDGFGVKTERSYSASLENFTSWLGDQHKAKKAPVLVIDEAQNIVRDGLRTLHYLMTYVTPEDILLMVILCGQEELATKIDRFPEIKSRMFPTALSALSREETEKLIRYRWQVASSKNTNPLPFQKTALDAIYERSKGISREVCKICDLALLAGHASKQKTINETLINSVVKSITHDGN